MPTRRTYLALWLIGYLAGFTAYLTAPQALEWLAKTLTLNQHVVGAVITGLASSIVAVAAVILWSSLTDHNA